MYENDDIRSTENFREVEKFYQKIQHKVKTAAPISNLMKEGEVMFLDDRDGDVRFYVKLNGTVYNLSLHACGFRAHLSGNQSNLTQASDQIELDTDSGSYGFDIGSDFDTGNYKFVAPIAGYYQIDAQVWFAAMGDGKTAQITVKVGANIVMSAQETAGANADFDVNVGGIIKLAEDDEITLYASHNKGSDDGQATAGANGDATFMSGFLVRAA